MGGGGGGGNGGLTGGLLVNMQLRDVIAFRVIKRPLISHIAMCTFILGYVFILPLSYTYNTCFQKAAYIIHLSHT
jgi:hypothetical protein